MEEVREEVGSMWAAVNWHGDGDWFVCRKFTRLYHKCYEDSCNARLRVDIELTTMDSKEAVTISASGDYPDP